MRGALATSGAAALLSVVAFGQATDPAPAFAIVDVHATPRGALQAVISPSRRWNSQRLGGGHHFAPLRRRTRTCWAGRAGFSATGSTSLPSCRPTRRPKVEAGADAAGRSIQAGRSPRHQAGRGPGARDGEKRLQAEEVGDATTAPGCQGKPVPARPPSGVPGQFALPMTSLVCDVDGDVCGRSGSG